MPECLNQKIKEAYSDYFQIKGQKDARDTWIRQLITAQANAKNTTAKKLWQQLRQREAAQKIAAQVRNALGKTQVHSNLVQVEAPDSLDSKQRIMAVTKSTLEQACLEEAKRRFTQAAQSPLLQLPPTTGLGSLQIGSEAFLQILDGTFPYEQISNEYMRKLLHQLKKLAQFCKVSP